jgi:putative transposase
MARPPRVYLPDISLHVICRGVNRGAMFGDEPDRAWFLTLLERAATRCRLAVHAYVLMSTHFHLMVTPEGPLSLPRTMQTLGMQYVRYYNRKYSRIGPMWNERYRAIHLLDERYWLTCLRYIEQNPVRARIVDNPADYPWTSYAVHALGRTSGWLSHHPVYLALGPGPEGRQQAYRAICNTLVSKSEVVFLTGV